MMQLYPDQMAFVKAISDAFAEGLEALIMHAPTGFGKTQCIAFITRHSQARGRRVYITVHRDTLISQTHKTLKEWGVPHGFIASGFPYDATKSVYICAIETLRRRMAKMPGCDLLIVDEAHLACSATWSEVIDFYRATKARLIGATATPSRLDRKPLSRHFQKIIPSKSMAELINEGRLSDYRIFAPSSPDLTKLRVRMGDYVTADVEEEIARQHLVGDAIKHYRKTMDGKRALAFCVSVRASQETVKQFCDAGIRAEHMDAKTPPDQRRATILRMASGETKIISSVNLLSEGFDLSAQAGCDVPVEGAILLRPTQSLVVYLQSCGRALRKKDYPAIILDHAGNTFVHDLPDAPRFWSLESVKNNGASDEAAMKLWKCEECCSVCKVTDLVCPNCGAAPKVKRRGERGAIGTVDEDLVEVTGIKEARAKRAEIEQADTLEKLILLAKRKNFKRAWVANVWHNRAPQLRDFNSTIRKVNLLWNQVVEMDVAI